MADRVDQAACVLDDRRHLGVERARGDAEIAVLGRDCQLGALGELRREPDPLGVAFGVRLAAPDGVGLALCERPAAGLLALGGLLGRLDNGLLDHRGNDTWPFLDWPR